MSMGPMGMIGSAAGIPLSQAKGDADRKADGAADQGSQSAAIEQQSESSERDADGRRMWEGGPESSEEGEAGGSSQQPPASRDATGNRGNQLDLSG